MHYVRFLKLPKVHVNGSDITLSAVFTITTDLGETFFPHDTSLVASVRSIDSDGDIYLRKTVQWTAGMRSLPFSFDIARSDVKWPACVHVGERKSNQNHHFSHWSALSIMGLWSESLIPTKGSFETSRRVERRFTSLSERELIILEDAGDSIARHLWDGSVALTVHIDIILSLQIPSSLPLLEYVLDAATYRRLNVLELGCGCGVVGLFLAQTVPESDVLLTDLPEVTELVEANIERANLAVSAKITFTPLDWEAALPPAVQNRTNDLIIVSECTYNTDTLQLLVSTLSALVTRSPKAVIVVATKTRHDSEASFFDIMKKAGFAEDSRTRLLLPGEPGQGYADWATDVGVHVFHGPEHKLSLSPRLRSRECAKTQ